MQTVEVMVRPTLSGSPPGPPVSPGTKRRTREHLPEEVRQVVEGHKVLANHHTREFRRRGRVHTILQTAWTRLVQQSVIVTGEGVVRCKDVCLAPHPLHSQSPRVSWTGFGPTHEE